MTRPNAGIGAETAKKFASKGYSVALLSRSRDKLTPVEAEIGKTGGKALSIPTDAGRPSQKSFRGCLSVASHPLPATGSNGSNKLMT